MKTILIPVDFSKESEKALSVGAIIANRIAAKLVLTHMTDLNNNQEREGATDVISKKSSYSKLVAKRFDDFLQKDFLTGVLVEPLMQHHIDFNSISSLAEDISADLIIMGSKGKKELAEGVTGSNTEKVVRSSKVPVLVVKGNELNFSSDRILFVSDFNEESIDAYKRVCGIAEMLQSKMNFLYINLPGEAFKSTTKMDEVLFHFFSKAEHPDPVGAIKQVNRIADYSIKEGIYNFSNLTATDIIAIPTHGSNDISNTFHESISEDVANHSIIPVLTLRI
ncbi:universal stress protein [Marixanthomonas spongiae]|uniref:Universal stress protein n=1 Tax=Marixanthomonas spongiae TaxID=2174845 RepID=A0A2U0I3X5_9FLAO|nr:universal stress protein [Marixanthomonas spongiae]PVW15812.1 universal stress protein [Marixanthomonas spongiae]